MSFEIMIQTVTATVKIRFDVTFEPGNVMLLPGKKKQKTNVWDDSSVGHSADHNSIRMMCAERFGIASSKFAIN